MQTKLKESAASTHRLTLTRPHMLHHTAYVTHDAAATVEFYTKVLGMDLVSTVIDDAIPSTGDPYPYIHLFFEMDDGSTIAFFESLDLPPPSPVAHPAYNIFNHLALDVGTKENVIAWAERLKKLGVDFIGPTDHGIIYSIYFHDPNGIRLELTANVSMDWKKHGSQAHADIAAWQEIKERSRRTGDKSMVSKWISERRARHKAAN